MILQALFGISVCFFLPLTPIGALASHATTHAIKLHANSYKIRLSEYIIQNYSSDQVTIFPFDRYREISNTMLDAAFYDNRINSRITYVVCSSKHKFYWFHGLFVKNCRIYYPDDSLTRAYIFHRNLNSAHIERYVGHNNSALPRLVRISTEGGLYRRSSCIPSGSNRGPHCYEPKKQSNPANCHLLAAKFRSVRSLPLSAKITVSVVLVAIAWICGLVGFICTLEGRRYRLQAISGLGLFFGLFALSAWFSWFAGGTY
jgi:hypothetical protein